MTRAWSVTEALGFALQRSVREMLRTEPRRPLPVGKWVKADGRWAVWVKGGEPGWRYVRVQCASGATSVERVTSTKDRATGCLYFVASRPECKLDEEKP